MNFLLEGLTALIVGVTVVMRYINIHRREYDPETLKKARLMWGIYFCIAAAAVTHFSAIRAVFAVAFGDWFATLPRAIAAWVGYTLTIVQCYGLAPHLRARSNWPVWSGVVMIASYATLVATDASWHMGVFGHIIYSSWLAVIAGGIAVRGFAWSFRQERHLPMKLRLAAMVGTHICTVAWMFNDILDRLAMLFHFNYNHDLPYTPVLALLFITFVVGYLTPTRVFVFGAKQVAYFDNLMSFVFARTIECVAANLLGRRRARIDLLTIVRAPDQAVYMSVISLLDMPKKLSRGGDCIIAQALSMRLALVSEPDLHYNEVVRRIRLMGQEYVWHRIWPALSLRYTLRFFDRAHE